jgi:hypothetical protein
MLKYVLHSILGATVKYFSDHLSSSIDYHRIICYTDMLFEKSSA